MSLPEPLAEALLGCPNCGGTQRIYTMETMAVEYPVVLTREMECGYDYTGDESRAFDGTAEPDTDDLGRTKLVCHDCDHEFTPDLAAEVSA